MNKFVSYKELSENCCGDLLYLICYELNNTITEKKIGSLETNGKKLFEKYDINGILNNYLNFLKSNKDNRDYINGLDKCLHYFNNECCDINTYDEERFRILNEIEKIKDSEFMINNQNLRNDYNSSKRKREKNSTSIEDVLLSCSKKEVLFVTLKKG